MKYNGVYLKPELSRYLSLKSGARLKRQLIHDTVSYIEKEITDTFSCLKLSKIALNLGKTR